MLNRLISTEGKNIGGTNTVHRTEHSAKFNFGNFRSWYSQSTCAKIISVICAIAVVLGITASNFSLCYAVELNGETVGTLKSKDAANAAVTRTVEQAENLLGYDVELGDISISASIEPVNSEKSAASTVSDTLLKSVDGIKQMYVLYSDDNAVGAFETSDEIYSLIDSIVAVYSESTSVTNIIQNISIVYEFVNTAEINRSASSAFLQLSPANTRSDASLDIVSITPIEYYEDIPFETVYIDDDTMYSDEEIVEQVGIPGSLHVYAYAEFINAVATGSKTIVSSETEVEPVTEIVRRGTVERPSTESYGYYIWPADGIITSHFGGRETSVGNTNHKGLDIGGSYAQNIYAADGGEVIFADYSGGYGNKILIRHDNGVVTCYGHMSDLAVSVGERVFQGQVIGYMGSTGWASGVHVHFEIQIDGTPVDPFPYLS